MTDNEIIKALECCNINGSCSKCPYDGARFETERDCASEMTADALALINRQRAEIERLEKAIEVVDFMEELREKQLKRAKAEAVKEFCERMGIEYVENDI